MARRYYVKINNIVWDIIKEIYLSRLPAGIGDGPRQKKPKTKSLF